MITIKRALLIITVLLAMSACSSTYVKPDYSQHYWPKVGKKRLQLLNIIYSDSDVKPPSSRDIMFGGEASFAFTKPLDIVADAKDNVYVTDNYRSIVVYFNESTGAFGQVQSPSGWQTPNCVAVDNKNGLLAVGDGSRIFFFDLGTRSFKFVVGEGGEIARAAGVALDPDRKLVYVSDIKSSKVLKYSYSGEFQGVFADSGAEPGKVFYPYDIELDDEGNVHIMDTMNWRVQVIAPDGKFIRQMGEHGSAPGQFGRPKGLSVSKDGVVLVTDADFNVIIMFTKEGRLLTYFGGMATDLPGAFITPSGIFIDDNDKIYLVDQTNRRIQTYQLYTDKFYESQAKPEPPAAEPKKAQ